MAAIGLFGFLSAFGSLSLSILLAMGGSSLPRWCHPFTFSISFFLCSIVFAIWFNYLDAMALLPIVGAFLLAQAMVSLRQGRAPWRYALCVLGVLALSLALALHMLPGFNNPKLLDQVTFGQSVIPFNLYANYDKAVVGLVLLIMLNRSSLWGAKDCGIAVGQIDAGVAEPWSQQTLCWAVPLMCFGVTVLALAMGLPLDVKLGSDILVFYWVNLLFTCVAEEAFFRLLIQDNIVWVGRRYLGLRAAHGLALGVATLLFLLAHTGGVLQMKQAVLIGVAGFLYAWVYHKSGKLQWAIAIHFGVNAMHITFLRYPMVF